MTLRQTYIQMQKIDRISRSTQMEKLTQNDSKKIWGKTINFVRKMVINLYDFELENCFLDMKPKNN
jgi:hypothetical protein